MKTIIIIALITLLLLAVPISAADQDNNTIDYDSYRNNWDSLPENQDDWICVDHALNYSRNNLEWGMVIVSPSPRFSVQPHMTNYKIEGNTLLIHEAQINKTYELEITNNTMTIPYHKDFPNIFLEEWEKGTYFHFIPDKTNVIRVYTILNDNRDDFFDYENMSVNDTTDVSVELDDSDEVEMIRNDFSNPSDNTPVLNATNKLNDSNITDHGEKTVEETESFSARFIAFIRSLTGLFA